MHDSAVHSPCRHHEHSPDHRGAIAEPPNTSPTRALGTSPHSPTRCRHTRTAAPLWWEPTCWFLPSRVSQSLCLRLPARLISEHTPCCTRPGANPPHSAAALGPATDLAEPINRIEPNPPSPAQEPNMPTLHDAGPSAPVRMDHQQRGRFVPFNVDASRPAGRSDQLATPTLHSDFVPAALTHRPGRAVGSIRRRCRPAMPSGDASFQSDGSFRAAASR